MTTLSLIVLALNLVGLALTAVGAFAAARAVRLTNEEAVHIGVSRWVAGSDEENLKLPAVQNLLRQSAAASRGLLFVVAGTIVQAFAVLAPLVLT